MDNLTFLQCLLQVRLGLQLLAAPQSHKAHDAILLGKTVQVRMHACMHACMHAVFLQPHQCQSLQPQQSWSLQPQEIMFWMGS